MDTGTIVVLSILGAIIYTSAFAYLEETIMDGNEITPWSLKDSSGMNWFGCWLWAIIVRILNPIWSIIYFVYWITHI